MLVLLFSLGIIVLDQATKTLVKDVFCLYPNQVVPVVPGLFNLTYVRNTGAAWGMLGGLNGWLAVLSVVVLLAIVVFRRSILTDSLSHRLALASMIGGIVGNLLDRVRLSFVVDFLDFHWGPHHFPSFNVADAAICVGVGLYLLSALNLDRWCRRDRGSPAAAPCTASGGDAG
jgi:signal peptidase II